MRRTVNCYWNDSELISTVPTANHGEWFAEKYFSNFAGYIFLRPIFEALQNFLVWGFFISPKPFQCIYLLMPGSLHIFVTWFWGTNVWFISYLKCSNWRWLSKLSPNFKCLFTFCYLDGANSIKTDLNICNLCTSQFASYKVCNLVLIYFVQADSKK